MKTVLEKLFSTLYHKGRDDMIKYILRRLVMIIPILIAVAVLIFTLMYFVPGDPARIMLSSSNPTEEQVLEMREAMGLNRPYGVRLLEYLRGIFFHFDFGKSFRYGTPVLDDLVVRFPKTLVLASMSIILAILFGVPIGVRAAVPRSKNGYMVLFAGDNLY